MLKPMKPFASRTASNTPNPLHPLKKTHISIYHPHSQRNQENQVEETTTPKKTMNPSPSPPPPSTPPPPNPPPQNPMDLVASALTHNSPKLLQQALDLFSTASRRGLTPTVRDRILNLAVKRAKPDLVRYLLDGNVGCSVEGVRPGSVGVAARGEGGEEEGKEGDVIKVLDVLVERGWDVNGRYTDRLVFGFVFDFVFDSVFDFV